MQFLDSTEKLIAEYPADLPVNYLNFRFSLESWLNETDLTQAKQVVVTSDWLYLYLADGNKPKLRDMLHLHLPRDIEKKVHLVKSECKYMDHEDWSLFYQRGLKGFVSI